MLHKQSSLFVFNVVPLVGGEEAGAAHPTGTYDLSNQTWAGEALSIAKPPKCPRGDLIFPTLRECHAGCARLCRSFSCSRYLWQYQGHRGC
jgi:hypothetical protein